MNEDSLRVDKWLWYARFFKTRSLAAKVCNAGKLRVSGTLVTKAHYAIRPGAVLTFPQAHHIRVIKVLALAERRGPATEASLLYEDLKPPAAANRLPLETESASAAQRPRGAGRPTKKERRSLDKVKNEP